MTYSLSCCTKHSPNFWVLMSGRVLGGVATSLLYSAFESWLVAEHFKRGYSGAAAAAGVCVLGGGGVCVGVGACGGGRFKGLKLCKLPCCRCQPTAG